MKSNVSEAQPKTTADKIEKRPELLSRSGAFAGGVLLLPTAMETMEKLLAQGTY